MCGIDRLVSTVLVRSIRPAGRPGAGAGTTRVHRWRGRAPLIGPATWHDGTVVPPGGGSRPVQDPRAAVTRDELERSQSIGDWGSPLSSNQ